MSDFELFRAALLHTPANPFRDERALVCHEDGGLLVHKGRIVASGDYRDVRASCPEAATVDWRGGFLLPGFVDTHLHYPQLRIIGGLAARSSTGSIRWRCRKRPAWRTSPTPPRPRGDSCTPSRRMERRRRWCLGRISWTRRPRCLKRPPHRDLRITSGLVVSDRRLRPELHRSPAEAYRDSRELIRRFHGRGRLRYAVTPRFALSTTEAMLEICQTLMGEHEGLRFQTHINENSGEVAEVARLFPWASDYLAVYERYGFGGRSAVMAHNVHPMASELELFGVGGHVDRALSLQQCRARQRDLPAAASPRRGRPCRARHGRRRRHGVRDVEGGAAGAPPAARHAGRSHARSGASAVSVNAGWRRSVGPRRGGRRFASGQGG